MNNKLTTNIIEYDRNFCKLLYNNLEYWVDINDIMTCPTKWHNIDNISLILYDSNIEYNSIFKESIESLGLIFDKSYPYNFNVNDLPKEYTLREYGEITCETNLYEVSSEIFINNQLYTLTCKNTKEICDQQLNEFINKWKNIKNNNPIIKKRTIGMTIKRGS